ncbi:hypothetical protein SAMN04487764_0179 [Gillisia sp. Hel1_33_143]|nr:hypothetical protein SAMN04487764_0179 [Gillisia sp. Hel1_33_143]
MYHTISKKVRKLKGKINSGNTTYNLGEIIYHTPFGFIYALDSEPIRDDFCEITDVKKFELNQTLHVRLMILYLAPKIYISGLYS